MNNKIKISSVWTLENPGEKLHEVLIQLEGVSITLEFDDQYVIEPAFSLWSSVNYMEQSKGSRVAEIFNYSSNTINEWISIEELRDDIAKLH